MSYLYSLHSASRIQTFDYNDIRKQQSTSALSAPAPAAANNDSKIIAAAADLLNGKTASGVIDAAVFGVAAV